MRKWKIIIIIILTIIVSIMTLGYAALQERIDIEGEASIESTYRVEITKVEEGTMQGEARSTNVPSYTGLQATFNVGLTNETDYITYIVEITNYSSVDVRLNNTTITSTNSNISYTKTGIRNGDTMLAGSTKVVTLKIKLKEAETSEQTGTININFDFTRLKGGVGEVINEDGLPNGYKTCDYLESTGTQYIDTKLVATNDMGIKVKYRYTADGSAAISGIFQINSPRTDSLFISANTGNTSGNLFAAHRGNSGSKLDSSIELNIDYTSSINYFNDGKIYLDDTYVVHSGTGNAYNGSILLFARLNPNDNNSIAISNSRIYYVEFTEGNEISHKLIPALDNNNIPCLYDTVSGKTFYNQGTGDFLYKLKE